MKGILRKFIPTLFSKQVLLVLACVAIFLLFTSPTWSEWLDPSPTVPLFPGAQDVQTGDAKYHKDSFDSTRWGSGSYITFTTKTDAEPVLKFYDSSLDEVGWDVADRSLTQLSQNEYEQIYSSKASQTLNDGPDSCLSLRVQSSGGSSFVRIEIYRDYCLIGAQWTN